MIPSDAYLLIITALRFLTFGLSIAGYYMLMQSKLRVHSRSYWAFILSAIACAVYTSGLLGILPIACWVIFGTGIFLFVAYLLRGKLPEAFFPRKSVSMVAIAFACCTVILFAALYSARFVHYDNFSHWGVAVKYLLIYDRFPDAGAALIDFSTYPLGSTSFLYFFCKIVGRSEGVMLIGQAVLILACFYAVFGVVERSRRLLPASVLGLSLATLCFLNQAIRMNTLLVDLLLPALALCAVATASTHRDSFWRACFLCAPMLALLTIAKTSGLFFAGLAAVYLLSVVLSKRGQRSEEKPPARESVPVRLAAALLAIAFAVASFLSWQLHVSVDLKGVNSKHTVSAENIQEVYSEKTPEIIAKITDAYIDAIFTPGSMGITVFAACNALGLIAYLVARFGFGRRWRLLRCLCTLDIAVVVYYVGIWGMYLLTMPTEEALILAGFERYASSITIFFVGALGMCIAGNVESSLHIRTQEKYDPRAFKSRWHKDVYQSVTLACVIATGIILQSEIAGMNSMREAYPASLPARVEAILGDNWAQEDQEKHLLYATDTDRQISDHYLQYVARYFLFDAHVDAVAEASPEQWDTALSQYDYLVVLEEKENTGNQYGLTLPAGKYPVQLLLEEKELLIPPAQTPSSTAPEW